MRILVSPEVKRKIRKLHKRYPDITTLLDAAFVLYMRNPRDPRLRLHKLQNFDDAWSVSVKYDLRVLFVMVKEGIYVTDVGSHDEVYR